VTALTALAFVGNVFLLYTFVAVGAKALRRRDAASVDVVPYLALLVVWLTLPVELLLPPSLVAAVPACLPVAALLIVRHFHSVPSPLPVFGWVVPVGVILSGLVWGLQVFEVIRWAVPAYLVAGLAVVSLVLVAEARRSSGVHQRRIGFAAAGTGALAVMLLVASISAFLQMELRRPLHVASALLNALTFIFYFLAFAPPRRLITRWRNGEQASYLAQTYEREPEERGWLAAEDLLDGVQRCVGPSLAVIARPRAPGSDRLIVRASTDRSLVGSMLVAADGLLGAAHRDGVAVLGKTIDCGADLVALFARYGRSVLIAPIVANSQTWGVVLTVHRRGPLFPDDDLGMLVQLGRSAAIAFDHAALIVERRERAREQADARLRELESRVGLMLDSIKDYAMLVLDEGGIVAAWHVGAQEVFGYTREQITRESAASLFDMEPAVFTGWLAEALARGKAEREVTCRRPDGRTFAGITTIRPLVAENGSPPGFVVVTRDLTEHRSLEERLHHGQKMQAIGQLAGGVAHDFNNLLTAIIGYADWLERDMAGDPRADQVHEIQRAAERAADLTRQLLAFSRRQVVQATSIDLSRLVQELLPMLRRLIGSRIEIVDATSALASPVVGDRSQVEQVIVNLVLNARDAMPNGGRVSIRTTDMQFGDDMGRTGLHGSHVLLEVADTGVGMDAETRRRAFEPFFTTKEVGSGTGLGLATVYGIVQQMGGLIEVDSELSRGTTFRLYLPHSAEPALQRDRPMPPPVTTGCETLLLIEDDDALRTYLVHVLEGHGYHVIPAEGAEAALTVTEAEVQSLDLVISDIVMPGMTGPEVVAELAQLRPGLPALYISGGGGAGEAADAATGVPGPMLQKPFSSTDLLAKVRQILSVA
jgi:PAS domain S-box-containing protein